MDDQFEAVKRLVYALYIILKGFGPTALDDTPDPIEKQGLRMAARVDLAMWCVAAGMVLLYMIAAGMWPCCACWQR